MLILKIPFMKLMLAVTVSAWAVAVVMDPTVKVALIGLVGNVAIVILGLVLKSKITDVHMLINSRLTELVAAIKISSHQEGREEGIRESQAKQAIKDQGVAQGRAESQNKEGT
jgi:hypothetical protein